MTALVVAGGVFALVAALVVVGYRAAVRLPETMARRGVERRIEELSGASTDEGQTGTNLIKGRRTGLLPFLDRLAEATQLGSACGRFLEQSGLAIGLSAVVALSAIMGLVLAIGLNLALHMTWVSSAGGAVGALVPVLIIGQRRRKRLGTFEEQLPEALDLLSRSARAGHAFTTGLKMVAEELPEPVGPEFRKTFDEQNFGLPLKDALANLAARVPLLDVQFFATAVLIQRETGGNLAEILDNLSRVVRERFKILRQVRVYTAHGRMTGYVLLALPAALAVALMFINPEHTSMLFKDSLGRSLLVVAGSLQTVGYLWIRKVVTIKV